MAKSFIGVSRELKRIFSKLRHDYLRPKFSATYCQVNVALNMITFMKSSVVSSKKLNCNAFIAHFKHFSIPPEIDHGIHNRWRWTLGNIHTIIGVVKFNQLK